MSGVTIEPFRGADLDLVVEIWNRALPRDATTVARFASWLFGDTDYRPSADSGVFVARHVGRAIGFARAIVRLTGNESLGLEAETGWLPVLAVAPTFQRQGVGRRLLDAALVWLAARKRKRIWISGGSGSAPGYVFPGVDIDAYPGGLALLTKHGGFTIDHHAVSMSASTLDFDFSRFHTDAWSVGKDVVVQPLSPNSADALLAFMTREFPGDWVTAARAKIRAGQYGELLIAKRGEEIVGYCQWEAEHFGPFGVSASERNARIGAKLFVETVRRIHANDGRSVWFNWADPDAQRFYERFGLKPLRRFAILRKDI